MKKLFLCASLILAMMLCGCSSDDSSSKSEGIKSSEDFVEQISSDIEITNVTKMAADMIGAEEGTSFKYEGTKYEIYRFEKDSSVLQEAAKGEWTYEVEGFGEFTSDSLVNGEYVMIYDKEKSDSKVEDAFTSAKP